MNGVRYVAALMASLDPSVTLVIMDLAVLGIGGYISRNCVSSAANKPQYSETPYRLSVAFEVNFGPLAPRDPGSLSMKSGDLTC
jgi:hypothetical protein